MYLGLDFGTSGARSCLIDVSGKPLHQAHYAYPERVEQTPLAWREALLHLLHEVPPGYAAQLHGIAIDGTSGSVLLCDDELKPVSPCLLYSDQRAIAEANELSMQAPAGHLACSPTSGLAKFLWLTRHFNHEGAAYFLHQADWLAALLTGQGGICDYHNALKTGYDVVNLRWPDWVMALPNSHLLPQVRVPGNEIGSLKSGIAEHFGFNPACRVHAGTTDSIAAFIAAGVRTPGQAVTSLGSTIVLKLLSERPVEQTASGIYSHRYGKLWLAGGASNAGGKILRHYFSDEQLSTLSAQIDPHQPSGLDYYPLTEPGERFPVCDPAYPPRLSPKPDDDVRFLHGLLEGLSRIEVAGYTKLAELGATPLREVYTCGGGANNPVWRTIRTEMLGVPIHLPEYTEAAFGSALLAQRGGL
ncbi:MAG: FGGY-family carbohydrate kinase [Pseudomonadota bacterium]